jgi:hypothetical protein
VDPPSQAEAPDETIDPKNLPTWMRRPVSGVPRAGDDTPQLEERDLECVDEPAWDKLAAEELELERLLGG